MKNIKFEKIVRTKPPYDKRSADPNKNYGVGGLSILFILKGPKGAVQFMLHAKCYLAHVVHEWDGKDYGTCEGHDIGYHSPIPMYEGQTQKPCDILPGKKCYYDGSSLRAQERVLPVYLDGGEPALWKLLEQEYYDRFGKES